MNFADSIAQINEKVDDTIQQAKSLLASDGGLITHDKRKMINKNSNNSVQKRSSHL